MIDITHKRKPDFVHLVLIIAVVCLALGAITPSASAVEYDDLVFFGLDYSEPVFYSGSYSIGNTFILPDVKETYDVESHYYPDFYGTLGGRFAVLSNLSSGSFSYDTLPYQESTNNFQVFTLQFDAYYLTVEEKNYYIQAFAEWFLEHTNIPSTIK